jgi:magnesium transporter
MRKIKYKSGRKIQSSNLEYTGIHNNKPTELQLFVYAAVDLVEFQKFQVAALHQCLDLNKINWLNVHGLNDIQLIKAIGASLKVDDFILADILNTTRRTKIEELDDTLFFNIKSILPTEDSDSISVEQISFLVKNGILVSFQEKKSEFFMHIRERIRTHSGIVRHKKADYLLYLMLDAVMENFYITIEDEEDKVEDLISLSKVNSSPAILEQIEKHRDNFNFLKRSIIPLRDSLYSIKSMKDDTVFNAIEQENYSFFARLYQKSLELLDQIEDDIVTLESASNYYFASQSHKMNEIMKTLTIVSAIFIPLTFIVGIYGMNFENMPELKRTNGYFVVLGTMFLIVIAMVYYFKRRRWF